jgi:hypothetical protein
MGSAWNGLHVFGQAVLAGRAAGVHAAQVGKYHSGAFGGGSTPQLTASLGHDFSRHRHRHQRSHSPLSEV